MRVTYKKRCGIVVYLELAFINFEKKIVKIRLGQIIQIPTKTILQYTLTYPPRGYALLSTNRLHFFKIVTAYLPLSLFLVLFLCQKKVETQTHFWCSRAVDRTMDRWILGLPLLRFSLSLSLPINGRAGMEISLSLSLSLAIRLGWAGGQFPIINV